MAAKDEDGNVNADGNQAESSDIDQYLDEISSNRRLYQDPPVHEVESHLAETKETTGTSDSFSLGVDDQETSNEQGTSTNQLLADSSTTSIVPVTSGSGEATSQPSSSDITNVETKSVPVTSVEDEMISPYGAPSMADDEDVANAIDQQKKLYIELSELGFTSSDLEPEQSITTASSPGRSPSVPITKTVIPRTVCVPQTQGTPQAMNPRYPQWQVPPGQYGNIMRPPYLPPPFQQHGGSNMAPYGGTMVPSPNLRPQQIYMGSPYLPPSARPFQQHGGGNMAPYGIMVPPPYLRPNQIYMGPPYFPPSAQPFQQRGGSNMAPYGTMVTPPYLRPEQNDIYHMPQPDPSMVPYNVYMGPYAYGYDNPFDTSAYSRFGYEGVPGNYLSSIRQHQSGDSIVRPPRHNRPPRYNRPPRHNRQQRQQLPWSDDLASQNEQDDRSDDDPSDQTQRDN